MTSVTQLIAAATPHIPFSNEAAAHAFLNQYDVSDQAALISALYIGRDHIHNSSMQPNYVPNGIPFDRYFHTGNAPKWLIIPSEFAGILYRMNTNASTYYSAFLRCVPPSAIASY